MASGKQLSFQYGEVSPSLRFRSDAVSYASGLSKLTNMYVRRAGGVSNRQGFEFVKLAETQTYIPERGGTMGVKAYTYWAPLWKTWVTAEFARDQEGSAIAVSYTGQPDSVYPGTTPYNNVQLLTNSLNPTLDSLKFTLHKDALFISPGFPTVTDTHSSLFKNLALIFGIINDYPYPVLPTGTDTVNAMTSSSTYGKAPYMAVSYLITATYEDGQEAVIAEKKSVEPTGTAGNNATTVQPLAFPHAELQTKIGIIIPTFNDIGIKKLTLYRASGYAGFGSSIYSLVGSQLYKPSNSVWASGSTDPTVTGITPGPGDPVYGIKNKIVNILNAEALLILSGMKLVSIYWPEGTTVLPTGRTIGATYTSITLSADHTIPNAQLPKTLDFLLFYANEVTFSDYGSSTLSVTPPIDSAMMADFTMEPNFNSSPDSMPVLGGSVAAAYYQQRLVLAMEPGTTKEVKSGTIIASKIGAPKQLKMPQIYSDTGAFSFNIPITDGTPCHALLAMERLMAFTERGVYIIRGGEQGILTPTSVNPLLVSEEGCSKVVEPKMSGRKGYFVNASHTKLMAIEFGADGNVNIFEASVFSDHTLYKDIVQLEVLGGGEDTVYLLRRDGKLVRVTTADEGSHGFAIMETDGYIESIYRGKALRPYAPTSVDLSNSEKYYDVLMCYVIRNGYRTLERMNVRDDLHREGEFFADCYESFGMRLSEFGNEGYTKIGAPDSNNPRINIQNPGGSNPWTAGTPITIWSTHAGIYQQTQFVGGVMHFFYDDAEGKLQFLRFIINTGAPTATGDITFPFEYTGYFESDVPASLQDVNMQNISTIEKKRRQTRWAPAINFLNVPVDLAGPYIAAHDTGDGTVENYNAAVSIMADGEVISSPNNPYKPTIYMKYSLVTEDVSLELPDYYTYGYVGIPYTSEFETLDLEAGGEKTLTDAKKLLNAVGVGFNESRGGFFGMPNQDLTNMEEIQPREDEDFSNQTGNTSGHLVINVPAGWNEAGRVNIKQVDPAPITILSVYPKGISGD